MRRDGPPLADLARTFVGQLDDPGSLGEDILDVDLRAAGVLLGREVLDERELPDDWEPTRTPAAQKAISRVIESRGLTSWLERHLHTPLNQGQRASLLEAVGRTSEF